MHLDIDKLRDTYTYNPDTGTLHWTKNNKPAGSVFACGKDRKLYRRVRFDKKDVSAHRVVWAIVYGYVPDTLDHIDGDGLNNKLGNLREATLTENQYNRKISKANSTGHKGVSKRKDSSKFFAFIKIDRKSVYLGSFTTPEDASDAYTKAATALHGKYLNLGV
jgi:hypothetical protein